MPKNTSWFRSFRFFLLWGSRGKKEKWKRNEIFLKISRSYVITVCNIHSHNALQNLACPYFLLTRNKIVSHCIIFRYCVCPIWWTKARFKRIQSILKCMQEILLVPLQCKYNLVVEWANVRVCEYRLKQTVSAVEY